MSYDHFKTIEHLSECIILFLFFFLINKIVFRHKVQKVTTKNNLQKKSHSQEPYAGLH